jgi:hypothetical protein
LKEVLGTPIAKYRKTFILGQLSRKWPYHLDGLRSEMGPASQWYIVMYIPELLLLKCSPVSGDLVRDINSKMI